MATNIVFKSILSATLMAAFATFSSCSSDGGKKTAETEQPAEHQESASTAEQGNPQFTDEKVKAVYEHYIHVKNALVNSDLKEAQTGAAALQSAFSNAGGNAGAELAAKIASAGKIEDQRAQFNALTTEVEKLVKSSKLTGGKVYKQYCPMADGYWLSSESGIKNPYYGSEMLECGEVKEEIK